MYTRQLAAPHRSFFLFGPRGVGKSTWVSAAFPESKVLSLLDQRLYLRLLRDPHALDELTSTLRRGDWVVLDEVQRVPDLLNEVHRLIEEKHLNFALTGSSARKLKRGAANLLGGRANILKMTSLSQKELGKDFNLERALQWGTLPMIVRDPGAAPDILESYVGTYLKEEIKEEGLVRKLEPFVRFLEVAGLMNGEILNLGNISREAAVVRTSLEGYFSVLEDTLLARRLFPYQPGLRVREVKHPKLYWFDCGVARGAAGLMRDPVDSLWLGKSLETLILHELDAYQNSHHTGRPTYYYRTGAGVEIDFVVETRKKTLPQKAEVILIEAKHSKKWDRRWCEPCLEFSESGKVAVKHSLGVYLGKEELRFGKMQVLPLSRFLELLHDGRFF